jgi:trans-2-enoyl-CoA reductase
MPEIGNRMLTKPADREDISIFSLSAATRKRCKLGENVQASLDSVHNALRDTEYPAEKRDLVEHAKQHGASDDVLDALKQMPDKVYTSAADVDKGLGGKKPEGEKIYDSKYG